MSNPIKALIHPERLRATGHGNWFTLLGLVLVPLIVGGLLTWALWDPTNRLDRITAAVVNNDEAVEIDGQVVPLGRQLASGLVTSSGTDAQTTTNVSGSDSTTNLTWEITNEEDARAGLHDGRYAAVVIIGEDFSADATSWADPETTTARQATIDVETSPRARSLDQVIAQTITAAASRIMGLALTENYVNQTLTGFTTMGTQLQDAATGAEQLADGAAQAGDGAGQLADGADDLADGLDEMTVGADGLTSGMGQITTGSDQLADGLQQLADQTQASAALASGSIPEATALTAGMSQLSAGIDTMSTGAAGVATGATTVQNGLTTQTSQLQALQDDLDSLQVLSAACTSGDADACTQVQTMLATLAATTQDLSAQNEQLAGSAGTVAAAASGLSAGLSSTSTSVTALAAGTQAMVDGVEQSASGMGTLAAYLQRSAAGASDLSAGAAAAMTGAGQLTAGAAQASTGAGQLASGAQSLSTGLGDLGDGAGTLAGGLTEAVDEVPGYTDTEAEDLAQVIANPVTTNNAQGNIFGSTLVPYLMVLAMWLGALVTFLVVSGLTDRVVGSTRPSWQLAGQAYAPGALIATAQGLLIALTMANTLGLEFVDGMRLTVFTVLAGLSFTAVNQGLAAAWGGLGRFLSLVVATVALGGAVVSTAPGLVSQVYDYSPLGAALSALLSVLNGGSLLGPSVTLVMWGLAGFALTALTAARRRVVSAHTLARWVAAA